MALRLNTLLILSGALAITASAQQPVQPAKTWAVVVGISRYQKLPGGQQLQFADRDAALFADAIQKRGVGTYNVRLLTGPEATVAAIKSALGTWLARSVSESDSIIFFFSGHGLFEREFGESYLLGCDSDAKDPFGTALSVSDLRQALGNRIRAGRVLVIVDAVRRDFFDPEIDSGSAKSFAQAIEQLTTARRGLSAILASGPGEFSREGQRWAGHGVFAKHLADVLAEGVDRNGDGSLTADEIFDVLATRVADDTSGKQHVWRSGTGLDQMAIARVERAIQARAPVVSNPNEAVAKESSEKPTETRRSNEAPPNQPQLHPTEKLPTPSPREEPPPISPGKRQIQPEQIQPAPTARPDKSDAPLAERRAQTPTAGVPKKTPGKAPGRDTLATAGGRRPGPAATPKTAGGADTIAPGRTGPPAPKARLPVPPETEPVGATQPGSTPSREIARSEVAVAEMSSAPKPVVNPPTAVSVSADRAGKQPENLSASVPSTRPEAAPSPLLLQLEAAIISKQLIEPRNSNAWDFYQRLAAEPGASSDLARLRPMLAAALGEEGRAIVSGDIRSDNVSDKTDDFKRAGQMLARARSLAPNNADVIALEKVSAAEALISLQFYDEAERALTRLQTAGLASVENALGLVYQGKLDSWRAERAFKRAIALDGKWAAPHYNLALLYRSQQNQLSLSELEAAAALDSSNVNLAAALGEEYFTRQQFKQSAEAYRTAIALKPSDDTLHTKLGHALYSQGLADEANREYQKARELRSKHP